MRTSSLLPVKLAVAAAFGLLTTTSAFALNTGNITLSGTVAPFCDIVIANGTVSNLTVGSAVTDGPLSGVTESCNSPAGYTLAIHSDNKLQLKGLRSGNAEFLDYTLKYGPVGAESALTFDANGDVTATNVTARAANSTASKALSISFSAKDLAADTYQDILRLTITAK